MVRQKGWFRLVKSLRFGVLNYLNCLPATLGLELGEVGGEDWTLSKGNPAKLNRAMRSGDLDVSLVSAAEYLEAQDRYRRLSGISLWCKGEVQSVTVFSPHGKAELSRMERPLLAVTPESATSVALARLLLPNAHTEPFGQVEDYREAFDRDRCQGVLLIGDRALQPPVWLSGVNAHDLSQWWLEVTQLPMTFAVWVARRELPEAALGEAEAILQRSLRWGRDNWERVLEVGCARSALSAERLNRYWQGIRFPTTEESERGFQEFRSRLCPDGRKAPLTI